MNQRPASRYKPRPFSLWRLASKELRETLRDRRTIITLVLMPLLVYPILSLIFRTFLLSNADGLSAQQPQRFNIVCYSEAGKPQLSRVLGAAVNTMTQLEKKTNEASQAASTTGLSIGQPPLIVPFSAHNWLLLDQTEKRS